MRKIALRLANKKRKGFTLVELIVVIAILAILAVGAIAGFGNMQAQAREAAARADANVILRTINTYNALAKTPITTKAEITSAKLAGLELKTASDDLVNMDLSVNISDTALTAALVYISDTLTLL